MMRWKSDGRATASVVTLLRFLVDDVLVAPRAELLPLDALRMRALVLRGEVIAILAVAAREDDFVAGHGSKKQMADGRWQNHPSYRDRWSPAGPSFPSELTTGIEPVTSPLPRVCS